MITKLTYEKNFEIEHLIHGTPSITNIHSAIKIGDVLAFFYFHVS